MIAAAISLVLNLMALAFAAGRLNARAEGDRRDINGLGGKWRGLAEREDRRYKQIVATMLLNAGDDKQKDRIAALLRDDSWPS